MGKISKGILGSFSGKVGTVVGLTWRGIDIIRSLPRKSTRTVTAAQLLQRNKFSIVIGFLKLIKPIITRYFGTVTGSYSKYNLATSYHLKEAVVYDGTNFHFNFNKVEISRGDLIGVQSPVMVVLPNTKLKFNWTNNTGQGQAKANDRLIAVVYEPISKTVKYSLNLGTRDAGTADFDLPQVISGLTVHCWISFVSDDEKLYATSDYLGSIVLT